MSLVHKLCSINVYIVLCCFFFCSARDKRKKHANHNWFWARTNYFYGGSNIARSISSFFSHLHRRSAWSKLAPKKMYIYFISYILFASHFWNWKPSVLFHQWSNEKKDDDYHCADASLVEKKETGSKETQDMWIWFFLLSGWLWAGINLHDL